MALTRGSLRQGKQSVLEYALHIRALVARAEWLPPSVPCDKFTQGLRPELSQACKRTDQGHIWTDLDKCISHAVGKEVTLLPKPVHAAASSAALSEPKRMNRFSGNKRPRQRLGSGPVSQGTGCFICGSQGHWKAECPKLSRHTGAPRGGGASHRGGVGNKRGGNLGQPARRERNEARAAAAAAPAE